jgi:hypothetical protein
MDDANRRFREEIYKETKKMKLTALQNADNYINWLNSLTRSTHTSLPSRNEEKLIAKLRQVSLDIKFTKLEVSLNEEGSAVIVWLRCSGKHQLYSFSMTILIIIEIGARFVRLEKKSLLMPLC